MPLVMANILLESKFSDGTVLYYLFIYLLHYTVNSINQEKNVFFVC